MDLPFLSQTLPSETIVEKVAARESVDPVDLSVPLFEVIDPDAMNTLVRTVDQQPSDYPFQIKFTYYGYEITVSGDGSVNVSP